MSMHVGDFIALVTIGCFIAAGFLEPDWQSGKFEDYVALLFIPSVAWPFYPFILYSLWCMLAVLYQPLSCSQRPYIRLGLWSGVLLSCKFMIMLFIIIMPVSDMEVLIRYIGLILLAFGIPMSLWWFIKKMSRRFGKRKVWVSVLILSASIYLGPIIYWGIKEKDFLGEMSFLWPVYSLVFLSFIVGPSWTFAFYLWLSVRIFRHTRAQPAKLTRHFLYWTAWIAGYAVAWRVAIELMLTKYAALPKEPPDCYITTAAACGHKFIVKSKPIVWADGKIIRVNDQMRNFKCAELALKAISPKTHIICRSVYNHFGPILAKYLRRPILADTAYLTLKPAEWLCRIVLYLLLKEKMKITELIYHRGGK